MTKARALLLNFQNGRTSVKGFDTTTTRADDAPDGSAKPNWLSRLFGGAGLWLLAAAGPALAGLISR